MSDGLLAVLPVVTTQYAYPCLESMLREGSAFGIDPADVLVVDNTRRGFSRTPAPLGTPGCTCYEMEYDHRVTCPHYAHLFPWEDVRLYRDPQGHNLGVARSWNVGAREVLDRGLDYLVLVSASMLFGPILHTTWWAQMQTFWGCDVIESTGNSWHLIALHRRLLEAVGLFCAGFYPAYVEQIDWCYRLRQAGYEDTGREQGWRNVWCNAMSQAVAGHLPAVACPWGPLDQLYRQRWGGPKGEERWTRPYGDRPLDYDADADTPIPVLAERYGLGQRGKDWW